LKSDPNCIFCKIVAGDLKSDVVAQDERTVAFHDIAPAAPLHVLVVPRTHYPDAAAVEDPADLQAMFQMARRVVRERGMEDTGYRLVLNTGPHAQQSVFHVHLHVLAGRQMTWPPG
jgi:histidine triad (HIT) family protein